MRTGPPAGKGFQPSVCPSIPFLSTLLLFPNAKRLVAIVPRHHFLTPHHFMHGMNRKRFPRQWSDPYDATAILAYISHLARYDCDVV